MTTLVIDGNNILVRSIKAMERTNLSVDGVPTGALHTFVNMISKYVREVEPERMVVCWDGGASAHRRAIYSRYKEDRNERTEERDRTPFALAKEFLTLANIQHIEQPEVEADDLIGAYWARRFPPPARMVILSGDKDFLQLLDHGVTQIRPGSGVEESWDGARVEREMGCMPRHIPSVMALTGDKGDGVPGIPRFGVKTACKALSEHGWDLDALMTTEDPKWRPKVFGYTDEIKRNLLLVNLRLTSSTLVPPPPRFTPTTLSGILSQELLEFLRRYRLQHVEQRFVSGTLWKEQAVTHGDVSGL